MAQILAVDDSDSIRMMMELAIEAETDHDLTLACDGKEALDAAKSGDYELVITDINMPEMNGFELIEALRNEAKYQKVPIVCLTTENEDSAIDKGKALGATGWLTKPFNSKRLLKVIDRLL